jgi:hypothetical protein
LHGNDGELRVHSTAGPSVPLDAPGFLLNRLSLSAFNEIYYRLTGRPRQTTTSYNPFFYPLGAIGGWNGSTAVGAFINTKASCHRPMRDRVTTEMLRTIAATGQGAFLAVLKTFGGRSIDAIVREAGGRLYPAKDGRLPSAMFRAGYPSVEQFKTHIDPGMSSTF